MDGSQSSESYSGTVLPVIARLEEARTAKSDLERKRQEWTKEVEALIGEQEDAIDRLLDELGTCRSQLSMQRDAIVAMETRAGDGVKAVAALNATISGLRNEAGLSAATISRLRDDLAEARVLAERDAADKVFFSKSIGELEHTQRQLTALLQAANERALHAEESLGLAVEEARSAQAMAALREQQTKDSCSARDLAVRRAESLGDLLSTAEKTASDAVKMRNDAEREVNVLRERADEISIELRELRQAARAASQESARWETECGAAQATARGLAGRLQETAAALDRERDARRASETRAEAAERNLSTLRVQLQEAGETLASLTAESTHLENSASDASKRASAAEQRAAAAEETISSLQRQRDAADSRLRAAQTDAAARAEQLLEEHRITQMENEARLRSQAAELNTQLAVYVAQLHDVQGQLAAVRSQAADDARKWQARLLDAEALAEKSLFDLDAQVTRARAEATQLRKDQERERAIALESAAATAAELSSARARIGSLEIALASARDECDFARAAAATADLAVGELRQQLALFRSQLSSADSQASAGLASASEALHTANESRADLLRRLEAATALAMDIKQLHGAAVKELHAVTENCALWERRFGIVNSELSSARADAIAAHDAAQRREVELRESVEIVVSQLRSARTDRDAALAEATAAKAQLDAERSALHARVLTSTATQQEYAKDLDVLRADLEREVNAARLLRDEIAVARSKLEVLQLAAIPGRAAADTAAELQLQEEVSHLQTALTASRLEVSALRGRADDTAKLLEETRASAARADAAHTEALALAKNRLEDAWENVEALHSRLSISTAPTSNSSSGTHASTQTLAPPAMVHSAVNTVAAFADEGIVTALELRLAEFEWRAQQQRRLDSAEADVTRELRVALTNATDALQNIEDDYRQSLSSALASFDAKAAAAKDEKSMLEAQVKSLSGEVDFLTSLIAREKSAAGAQLSRANRLQLDLDHSSALLLDANARLDAALQAQATAENGRLNLQARVDMLEKDVGELRSELVLAKAEVRRQTDAIALQTELASCAGEHVAKLEGSLALALTDVARLQSTAAGDALRRLALREVGTSTHAATREIGCYAAPRSRDASTDMPMLPSSHFAHSSTQTQVEAPPSFSADFDSQNHLVHSPELHSRHIGTTSRRPSSEIQVTTASLSGVATAAADLSIGLGESIAEDDVDKLRRRITAQAKALTASRARELERDARIADLSRATLHQQALLEAAIGPDVGAWRNAVIARREALLTESNSLLSTPVSSSAPASAGATSTADVIGVPLASSLMAHLVAAILATPGVSRAAASAPAMNENSDLAAHLSSTATSALQDLRQPEQSMSRSNMMSPNTEDPRSLVRSTTGLAQGAPVATLVDVPTSSTQAIVHEAPSAVGALQEARAATAQERKVRRAIRTMVAELREQILLLAPPRDVPPGIEPRSVTSINQARNSTSAASSAPRWTAPAGLEPQPDPPGTRVSEVPASSSPLVNCEPCASPHERIVAPSRHRRRTVLTSVSREIHNEEGPVRPAADPEQVSGKVLSDPSWSHNTVVDRSSALSDQNQHQSLSFVDAFGQTITLMARCEFVPAPLIKEASGSRATTEADPDAVFPLTPPPSLPLRRTAAAAAARAASLETLIRQHKDAFDTLFLTRKISVEPVTNHQVTVAGQRLRHDVLQKHSASPKPSLLGVSAGNNVESLINGASGIALQLHELDHEHAARA